MPANKAESISTSKGTLNFEAGVGQRIHRLTAETWALNRGDTSVPECADAAALKSLYTVKPPAAPSTKQLYEAGILVKGFF